MSLMCRAAHSEISARVAHSNFRTMVNLQFSCCWPSSTWLSSKFGLFFLVTFNHVMRLVFCACIYHCDYFPFSCNLSQVLHLVEQLCLALNDEFRTYLPNILPCCIQVLSDAERYNDYTYVLDILRTLEVFGG